MKIFIKLFAFICLLLSLFILYDRYDIDQSMGSDALERINPVPKTQKFINDGKYVEAQEYLEFFMHFDYVAKNPNATKLIEQIKLKREDLDYKAGKVVDGILYGKSDEIEGQIAAGASDLFLFGDLRDLAIEGYHKIRGQKVDNVLVALSTIGVIATGATYASRGTVAPTKGVISLLKFAKKSGKMPRWLGKYLVKSAKSPQKFGNFKHVKVLFSDIYDMVKVSGVQGSLKLLKKTKNVKSLKSAKAFSKTFGKNSSALSDILGKEALFIFSKSKLKPKVFLYASTYGKTGVKRAIKLGEKGFVKSLVKTVKISRASKIFGKNVGHMLKAVPNYLFYMVALISLLIVI